MSVSTERQGKCKPRGKPIQKGQVLNPGGRPKKIAELTEICQKNMPAAINVFLEIINNRDAKDSDRLQAATKILEYGFGRPMQRQELSGVDGESLKIIIKVADNADD